MYGKLFKESSRHDSSIITGLICKRILINNVLHLHCRMENHISSPTQYIGRIVDRVPQKVFNWALCTLKLFELLLLFVVDDLIYTFAVIFHLLHKGQAGNVEK